MILSLYLIIMMLVINGFLFIDYGKRKSINRNYTFDKYLDSIFHLYDPKLKKTLSQVNMYKSLSYYFYIKLIISMSAAILFIFIQNTNLNLIRETLINDNQNTAFSIEKVETGSLQTENEKILKDLILEDTNEEVLKNKIREVVSNGGEKDKIQVESKVNDIYLRLTKLRALDFKYFNVFLVALLAFLSLDIFVFIKSNLISLSRQLELLNLLIAAQIYSEIFKSANVVIKHISYHSKFNKQLFDELEIAILLNNSNSYENNELIQEVLSKVSHDELFHLFNKLVTFNINGIKPDFSSLLSYRQKSLNASFLKRRSQKYLIAMVPSLVIMFLGSIYFAQGINQYLNPINLILSGGM